MFVLPIPENVIQNPVKYRVRLVHEVDPIIQGCGFVLKGLFLDKQTAESIDALALNLMGKTPGRTCMLSKPRSDAVVIQIRELGLYAPAVLAIAGDPEMGALCLITFHLIGPVPCVQMLP